ncbi:MAG: hypothetical protein EPO55_12495 [Reyranella sp.]|uniref:hypothetical protein n=1 Tax=Reyranella sp. TaxID=1929291 RepID=UPI00120828EC|nr:hypothetical protein [Reyranella sp.]TAJ39402.1 MAG: hypothetical protein EPO55_12495 [Reyranella sp.]
MRPVTGILAVSAFAAVAAGCASDPYYARGNAYQAPSYAYSPGYSYYPPGYYRTTAYDYAYPAQPASSARSYDGYWDYQRNYRGIHASPEFSRM